MDGDKRWVFINRGKTTWTNEVSLFTGDGRLVKTPLPDTADFNDVIEGRLIATLNAPLGDLPAGALVAYSLADIAAGRPAAPELVMAPSASQAIEEVSASDHVLWVKALDDVSGKLFALTRGADGKWSSRVDAARRQQHDPFARTRRARTTSPSPKSKGCSTPPTLYAVTPNARQRRCRACRRSSTRALTRSSSASRSRRTARACLTSWCARRGVAGPVPTLIHAYGGFRVAQTPTYLTGEPYRAGPLGLFWVEQGNAYVLANIRGGGEYGPGWHEAALREKRQNSFDDLHAVAEDVVRTGVASKVAISGRSNGGVLVGAALNQHPDLYSGAIIGSPLFDMKRYSHLLAGASWIDEYGDPDKPAEWAFLSKYSPYQNVRPRRPLPGGVHSTDRPRTTASIPAMRARPRRGSSNMAIASISTNIWKAATRSAPTMPRMRSARRCC